MWGGLLGIHGDRVVGCGVVWNADEIEMLQIARPTRNHVILLILLSCAMLVVLGLESNCGNEEAVVVPGSVCRETVDTLVSSRPIEEALLDMLLRCMISTVGLRLFADKTQNFNGHFLHLVGR